MINFRKIYTVRVIQIKNRIEPYSQTSKKYIFLLYFIA